MSGRSCRRTGEEETEERLYGGTAIEVFFEFLFELLFEIIMQVIFSLGGEGLAHSVRKKEEANPFLAGVVYAALGALAGGLSLLLIPLRLMPALGVPGISLLLAPLVSGLLMKFYGDFRRRRGYATSSLATFWGGAVFAFAMALVRFLVLGRG